MGNCVSATNPLSFPKATLHKMRQIVCNEQIFILHLMYSDLSQRTVERKIDLDNFLLFFHKNGYWGERLFREFDCDETRLLSEEEFIKGIAKIFKSSEKDKISLLFKFFAKGKDDQGIQFGDLLTMLYNYPKQDLREILSDRDFIECQLKKRLKLIQNRAKDDQECSNVYRFSSSATINHPSTLNISQRTIGKENVYETPRISAIGKDIVRGIKSKYKTNETTVNLRDGDKVYEIRTSNIQQLVKQFALRIFREAKVDPVRGKLSFLQFYHWISTHQALYENYYNGFHHMVWETDHLMKKPKYLLADCEKTSDARLVEADNKIKVRLFLVGSIIVAADISKHERPVSVICLQGLTVKRVYDLQNGFGFEVTHRDGIYIPKKIYLKNQGLLDEWIEHLKFYKGESVHQKYEIGDKIGAGKFSIVYKCKHIKQGKEYALKEIATFKLDPEARTLIAHESSIMQIVSHPLLLEFKECLQTKTHIYIITELVKGIDLFEFVKEAQFLEECDAAKIAQQLICGIRFLHSFEIVHRDLKPENIMIVTDEETGEISNIKIIDFGFSNYLSKLHAKTSGELLAGTPNYISPQVLKEQPIGFKIDNFAIGVILFFMLTGSLPFNDYSLLDILENTMKGEYSFPQDRSLSPLAKDLTDKLLKNDPKQRISLDEALQHPWFNLLKSSKAKS